MIPVKVILDKEFHFLDENGLDKLLKQKAPLSSSQSFRSILQPRNNKYNRQFLRWVLGEQEGVFEGVVFLLGYKCSIRMERTDSGFEADVLFGGVEIKTASDEKTLAHWKNFIRCFNEGLVIFSRDGTILDISDQAPVTFALSNRHGVMLSRESLIGQSIFEVRSDLGQVLKDFAKSAELNPALRLKSEMEIENRWLQLMGFPSFSGSQLESCFLVAFDITDRKRIELDLKSAQEQIEQSAPLVSLGEFAAGISHEINTPLASISLISQIIESKKYEMQSEELKSLMQRIDKSCGLISSVVNNVKSFLTGFRNERADFIDLKTLVDEAQSFCTSRLERSSVKMTNLIPDGLELQCHQAQIMQVFLNLIINSVDAIKDQDNRWIETKAVVKDHFIRIWFNDSGKGMSVDVARKVTERFFSTKTPGEGLGLGLFIISSIIQGHGGRIKILENTPNTCFEIDLPINQSGNTAA